MPRFLLCKDMCFWLDEANIFLIIEIRSFVKRISENSNEIE